MAGLFAIWAVVATGVAVWQGRRLRLINEVTGFNEGGAVPEPRRQAAAAAIRRLADRVAPSAPGMESAF